MIRIIVLGVALISATPSHATPAHARLAVTENAYARCLARLIESRGLRFAVDHAGSTICDSDARKRIRTGVAR